VYFSSLSFFDFWYSLPIHLQIPSSVSPGKINSAKWEAESFLPFLPPHHIGATHLSSGPIQFLNYSCSTCCARMAWDRQDVGIAFIWATSSWDLLLLEWSQKGISNPPYRKQAPAGQVFVVLPSFSEMHALLVKIKSMPSVVTPQMKGVELMKML
jgi:hypothetical protein